MVFILVDVGAPERDFVLPNENWRCIVEEVGDAGFLPVNVAELIGKGMMPCTHATSGIHLSC